MATLFEDERAYTLDAPELGVLGNREKLAQWRCRGIGPAFYKLGRKVLYKGHDLNAWVEVRRVNNGQPDRNANKNTPEAEVAK